MAKQIVNRSEEVLRGDGLRLYGLDAEVEQKIQAKRDPEFERKIREWIEQVTGEKLPFPDDIGESLKSGIVLCKLVNIIWPGTIKTINTKPIALMEMENIGYYLKACWKIGVPSAELFVVSDLYLKKSIPSVLQNIYSLSRIAQSVSSYKGPKLGPSAANIAKPAKKWNEVGVGGPTFVTDLPPEESDTTRCPRCGLNVPSDSKFCTTCGAKVEVSGSESTLKKKLEEAEKYKQKLEQELSELRSLYRKELAEKEHIKQELQKSKPLPAPSTYKTTSTPTFTSNDTDAKRIKNLEIDLQNERKEKEKALREIAGLEQENQKLRNQIKENDRKLRDLSEKQLKQKDTLTFTAPAGSRASAKFAKRQSTLESPALAFLQNCMTKILFSDPNIDFNDVYHLNDLFKLDQGRRIFTQILKTTMKSVPSLVLSENSFELLLYLINTVLQQMDISDSKDLITAKVLMHSSRALSRKVEGLDKKEYVKQFIKDHEIWKSLLFWEEVLWDELSQKYRELGDDSDGNIAPLVKTVLPSFVVTMLEWGVPSSSCKDFMNDMCGRYGVDQKSFPILRAPHEKLHELLTPKEALERKGSWMEMRPRKGSWFHRN